ncbi:MAG TPA: dienelactone hydrolase family protein [Candidatus Eisenbacteria bacterium]|nr:dienelactone hydrolase family protein [Candidatus Eisenbacteria bacterium]
MRRLKLLVLALMIVPAASWSPSWMPGDAAAAGRDTSRVTIGSGANAISAFVAWPEADKPAPAVIVVHESWGLNGQIRTVAKRLAQEGYVAIVPDLYRGRAADAEAASSRGPDETQAVADLEAAAAWLHTQPRANGDRIGVMGFGTGGRLSQLLAMRVPLAALVMFYGRPETGAAALATLKAPLQAHFGGDDQGIGPEQVDALTAGIGRAGRTGEVHVYANAGPAFMHEGRDSYRLEAARLAWARTLVFLQKYLKS